MPLKSKSIKNVKIYRSDLPTVYVIKQINLMLLRMSKKGLFNKNKEPMVYHTWGRSYKEMRRYILEPPTQCEEKIIQIRMKFPEDADIFEQCAYYFRAFSKCQIFLDGNHRTGYFSLIEILKKNGLCIKTNIDEINNLSEYIKGKGWIKQCDINVDLKERDDEFFALKEWFEKRLQFR
jgi:prophage maintenance system killer protein